MKDLQTQVQFATLTEDDNQKIVAFSKQIDLNNTNQVINYGVKSQSALTTFSTEILGHKSLRDLGSIGESVSELVLKLRNVTEPKKRGFFGSLVSKGKYRFDKALLERKGINSLVEEIENKLKEHQATLAANVKLLSKLEELNFAHHKELTMYIEAGKTALTGNDENQNAAFFEKRITDLQLSRTMAAQLAIQIRMIQANNIGLIDKVQSSLNVVIPVWKTQLLVNANLHSSNEALRAQTAITDMTNSMVVKNAEELNSTVIETARQVERGIVDVESLRQANESVINVFNEVRKISAENREVRRKVEAELCQIEDSLKAAVEHAANDKGPVAISDARTVGLTL